MLQKKKTTGYQHIFRLVAIVTILFALGNGAAISAEEYSAKDLNAIMAKVWQNCTIDLDNLRGYIFNETDSLYNNGKCVPWLSSKVSVQDRFDWVWTVKDGYLGPSLKRINGKEISVNGNKIKITQKEYSLTLDTAGVKKYVNERMYHPKWEKWDTILDFFDDLVEGWFEQRRFARFDYKPGQYRYEGSREYEGHRVIEITYPSNANLGNGTTLVRMLVIPDENQLVAVALSLFYRDGYGFGQIENTMTMDNSHDNVWLPKEFRESSTSSWGHEDSHSHEFNDYAKTDVKAKFWFEDVKARIIYDLETPEPKK